MSWSRDGCAALPGKAPRCSFATSARPLRQAGADSTGRREGEKGGGRPLYDEFEHLTSPCMPTSASTPGKMSAASGHPAVGPVDAVVGYTSQSLLGQPGSIMLARPSGIPVNAPRGNEYQEGIGMLRRRSRSRDPPVGDVSEPNPRASPRRRPAAHGFGATAGSISGTGSPGRWFAKSEGAEGLDRPGAYSFRDVRFAGVPYPLRPHTFTGLTQPPVSAACPPVGHGGDPRQLSRGEAVYQDSTMKNRFSSEERGVAQPRDFTDSAEASRSVRSSQGETVCGGATEKDSGFGGQPGRKRHAAVSVSEGSRGYERRRISLYADQIINYSHGGLCAKRVQAAFMSVARAAGQPFLVVPRRCREQSAWVGVFPNAPPAGEGKATYVLSPDNRASGGAWGAGVGNHLPSARASGLTPWASEGSGVGPVDTDDSVLHMSEVSADETEDEMEDGEVEEAKKDSRFTRPRGDEAASGPPSQSNSSAAADPAARNKDSLPVAPPFGQAPSTQRENGEGITMPPPTWPFGPPGGLPPVSAGAAATGGRDATSLQSSSFGNSAGAVAPRVPSEAPSLLGPPPVGALFKPPTSRGMGPFGHPARSGSVASGEQRPPEAALSSSLSTVAGDASMGNTGSLAVAAQTPVDVQAVGTASAAERSSSMGRARPVDPRLLRQRKQQQVVDVAPTESVHDRPDAAGELALPANFSPDLVQETSLSSGLKEKATTQEVIRYVSSFDGSVLELNNPPVPPVPGTLPPSLQGTCVARGKLPLLLDLDNTLLHAQATAVTGCEVRLQDWLDSYGEPELYRFELPCNRKTYYMKLRPHLRTFLKKLEPFYEMSVYTNATQEYADIVVAILDENRQLFQDRIVARDSGFRGEASENKAVRRLYEGMDKRCIVAFDDRQNIWTDLPLTHVVKAQHYDFFDSHKAELNAYYPPVSNGVGGGATDILGGRQGDDEGVMDPISCCSVSPCQEQLPANSPVDEQESRAAAEGKKPCDWDRHLECMLKLFLHLHLEFFKDPVNANIGAILCNMQQKVLSGVGIFFTGFRKTFSAGAAVADCEERQAELAQRLGAKVFKRYDEEGVTHVVAGKNNTNNMLACKENPKLARVHTLWLYCCEAALARVPESAFDADTLCTYYDNSPPSAPYRDHWVHLAQKKRIAEREPPHPFPPAESLPVREFLSTGPYSDGATLTSPYEEVLFIWRPEKQTVRQLYASDDSRGVSLTMGGSKGVSIVTPTTATHNPPLCGALCGPGPPAGQGSVGSGAHQQLQRLHA
ncbi:NLI interacting factor family phosphatase [Besnoitia besnoiti]|uniref:protein-serine/threonine phosphatase n=1 Tax=Besnoitia besnoiti TaxID=94643 RepID=A0A2A9MAY9_BESBE|nr:NLI interacting factor family phosphatase [Besnoitia besnoiti]PFH35648.1 NLI interacting factor family phosphatase [Besnoitia besnoiti]